MLMRLRFLFLFILPLSLRTPFAESVYDSAKGEGLITRASKMFLGYSGDGYYMYQRDGIEVLTSDDTDRNILTSLIVVLLARICF